MRFKWSLIKKAILISKEEEKKKIARIVPPSFPTERPRSMNDGDDDRHRRE